MADSEKPGMMDSLLNKGEGLLDSFMDNPEKVAKAKSKADEMLSKHMDPQQAHQVSDAAENLLKKLADRDEKT